MKWRHLTNDITITSENDNSSCCFTASQTEQSTFYCKTATRCPHCNTLHVNWTCVRCVRRSVALRTPYNDTVHYRSGDDIILIVDENNRTNVSESTEKLTSKQKSLVKQQILM